MTRSADALDSGGYPAWPAVIVDVTVTDLLARCLFRQLTYAARHGERSAPRYSPIYVERRLLRLVSNTSRDSIVEGSLARVAFDVVDDATLRPNFALFTRLLVSSSVRLERAHADGGSSTSFLGRQTAVTLLQIGRALIGRTSTRLISPASSGVLGGPPTPRRCSMISLISII